MVIENMVSISKKVNVAMLLTLIVIATIFLMFRFPSTASKGGELIIAQSLEPDTLHIATIPGARDEAIRVAGLIYDTLVTFDWDMSCRLLLAKSWIADRGEPSITFYLRRDVRFHAVIPLPPKR